MDPLFPELPEDISAVSDEDLAKLISDHESAKALIDADDEEFLKGLDANEILAQLETGGSQYQLLTADRDARAEAHENFKSKKAELSTAFEVKAEEEPAPADDEEDDGAVTEEAPAEIVAEETEEVETPEEEKVEERELVTASARYSRRPPAATPERTAQPEAPKGTALVAAGEMSLSHTGPLDSVGLGELVRDSAAHHGPMPKIDPPGKYRFGGPEHKIARAEFDFPPERTLESNDPLGNQHKLEAVLVDAWPGAVGNYSLTASGGLCAPAEPFYSMVNFATTDEPVWDALPVFAARRGAVSIPESTVIGDITTAISSISEANDALGGTFATKSCQALDCVEYTEVAINIVAHCREYGNLNARSWPEKIAHENALTMAALAQTSEMFTLERIKALSVNVTSGAETLGALVYLVDAILKSAYGIRSRLRMPRNARFRALLPAVVLDILVLDAIQNQFDRYKSRGDVDAYLRSLGIDPVYYIDGQFAAGTDQTPAAAQAAGALDAFPDTIQWALYPEGAFLGIDMGVLELGIVRDSTLNETNDFQVFGERFRNVARIAPQSATYWETTDICANGMFPPAGTARTCD